MKIFIELYFNTFNYINFNSICSCIKKFFMQFYPTNYYDINIGVINVLIYNLLESSNNLSKFL
jgi:hypothetical protein